MQRASVSILADLHRRESGSLFRYLAESPSYISPAAKQWLPALSAMGVGSQGRVARLEGFLDATNEAHNAAGFPSNFASLHYLSMNYLLGRLIADKRALAAAYAEALVAVEQAEAEFIAPAIVDFIRIAATTHADDLVKLHSFVVK